MFNDRARPFYNLCDKIMLGRIAEKHYIPFMPKEAQQKWSKKLPDDTIAKIFELSMRHPYYTNVLCHRLWDDKKVPTSSKVITAWEQYSQEEQSRIRADLDQLSGNQSKMLIAIAKYGSQHSPNSKEFLALTKFSSSSAVQALKKLKAADYLYISEEGKYCLVDPLIKYLFM